MFFQIMFEGFKIVTGLECGRDFVLKGWTNIRQQIN